MSMKTSEFRVEVPAKWVLSGEHSVLRGKRALAFPCERYTLSLSYRKNSQPQPISSPLKELIERALIWLKLPIDTPMDGDLEIQSTIPMGAGLGSSAALCVAVSQFVLWKTNQADHLENRIALATHLEDFFHGKSSGMDITAIAHAKPILYSMSKKTELISEFRTLPRFVLHDSGKRGQTKTCIEKVRAWNEQNPEQMKRWDDQMEQSTLQALQALQEFAETPEAAEQKLARAMNQAQACFETWGLVPTELMEQKQAFLQQGALAVKLTGAGLGGFWITLWKNSKSFS